MKKEKEKKRWHSKTWYKNHWGIDVTKLNLKPKLIDNPLCRLHRWAPKKIDAWNMDEAEQEMLKAIDKARNHFCSEQQEAD